MNIQQYIESGILEQYVLGDLSPQQRQEVENYAAQYPAIKTELSEIETTLENVASAAAITPPAGLEHAILQRINHPNAAPHNPAKSSRGRTGRTAFNWLFFLGSLLLATSFLGNYFQWNTNSTLENNMAIVEQEKKDEVVSSDSLQLAYTGLEKNYNNLVFRCDPNTKRIQMNGEGSLSDPKPYSSGRTLVYNNSVLEQTAIETLDLPAAPKGKVYHLWGVEVINGELKPHDLGRFQASTDLVEVQFPKGLNVAVFAVTLENEGKINGPDLTQMYTLGNNVAG